MYRRIIILAVLACFCHCQTGLPQPQTDKDPVVGSGQGGVTFVDDEDLADMSGSGSGSGSGFTETVDEIKDKLTVTKKMTTTTKMTTTMPTTSSTATSDTICFHMRKHSERLEGSKYTPRCTTSGEFDALQCSKHAGTDDCWCSDLDGTEIPGTRLEAPNIPYCDEGSNMSPCLFQLVKNIRSRLYGAFRPRCASDGQFERIQCLGSMCFCVDEGTGKKFEGTEVHIPATPYCDDDSLPIVDPIYPVDESKEQESTEKEEEAKKTEKGNELVIEEGKETITVDVEEGPGIAVVVTINKNNLDKSEESDDKDDDDDSDSEESNKTGNDDVDEIEKKTNPEENRSRVADSQILTQPGLLGGIIGGSVVLLLGLVLLIMFIVYRMRKKDEGSYPLDEPRKLPNYSYIRAPEKEYYA